MTILDTAMEALRKARAAVSTALGASEDLNETDLDGGFTFANYTAGRMATPLNPNWKRIGTEHYKCALLPVVHALSPSGRLPDTTLAPRASWVLRPARHRKSWHHTWRRRTDRLSRPSMVCTPFAYVIQLTLVSLLVISVPSWAQDFQQKHNEPTVEIVFPEPWTICSTPSSPACASNIVVSGDEQHSTTRPIAPSTSLSQGLLLDNENSLIRSLSITPSNPLVDHLSASGLATHEPHEEHFTTDLNIHLGASAGFGYDVAQQDETMRTSTLDEGYISPVHPILTVIEVAGVYRLASGAFRYMKTAYNQRTGIAKPALAIASKVRSFANTRYLNRTYSSMMAGARKVVKGDHTAYLVKARNAGPWNQFRVRKTTLELLQYPESVRVAEKATRQQAYNLINLRTFRDPVNLQVHRDEHLAVAERWLCHGILNACEYAIERTKNGIGILMKRGKWRVRIDDLDGSIKGNFEILDPDSIILPYYTKKRAKSILNIHTRSDTRNSLSR